MTIRPIRRFGDPVLHASAAEVTRFDAALGALVDDLMETLLGVRDRAGVAAPQIGVGLRVFVYDAGGRRGHLVNPRLELSGDTRFADEACLSLPGFAYPTPRATAVTAHGFDRDGAPVTVEATGFLARALQHEADHLDGRLYVDTLRGASRAAALRDIRRLARARRSA